MWYGFHRSLNRDLEPRIPGFNPNDPQYMCFCRTLHAVRGAYSVAYFHIVTSIATFVFGCLMAGNPALMAVTIPLSIIVAFFSGLLLFGLRARFYKLLIPYLIMNIFLVLAMGILMMMASINLVEVSGYREKLTDKSIGQAVLIFLITMLGLFAEVWFFLSVLGALRYIRDMEAAQHIARITARTNIYAGAEFSPEAEIQRITEEYRLPPPPPAYSIEDLNIGPPQQLGVSFSPMPSDGPPGYDEACSSTSTSRTSLGPSTGVSEQNLTNYENSCETLEEKVEPAPPEEEKMESEVRDGSPVLTV